MTEATKLWSLMVVVFGSTHFTPRVQAAKTILEDDKEIESPTDAGDRGAIGESLDEATRKNSPFWQHFKALMVSVLSQLWTFRALAE